MLSLYFGPLIALCLGVVEDVWLLFMLYLLAGLGSAGIGMGVMHDALHGSYSRNKIVNRIMGYTMNLIGANDRVWKIKHNVLHHTYTNIENADEDIEAPIFLRFSPHSQWYWTHQFQHLYVWFFYGISTLSWAIAKDFIRLYRYWQSGYVKTKSTYRKTLLKLIGWKLIYFSYTLVIPLVMLPIAPWIVILAYLSMHFITGLSLSMVFQAAHVVSSSEYPVPDENGMISSEWTVHQLETTCNFAPKSRVFYWLIGGLNYQIEHHLFPHICHTHYKKISPIVKQTAAEFGIPYQSSKTFLSALSEHVKMLKRLGKKQFIQSA